jgi:uncharacterized protein (DUF433 family)
MELPDFLETDPDGEIRLKGHRIRVIDVAARYEEGFSAETIAFDYYPTLELGLVYTTIGFYLDNEVEVRSLLEENRAAMARLAARPQTTPTLAELRRRMAAKKREAS